MTIQEIKQRLYAMRNGMLADRLRQLGSPYTVIFGLNLPQLGDIARDIPRSASLARELWSNSNSRECMLLAPMVWPAEDIDIDEARRLAAEALSTETADILCMKLLRHCAFARELAEELALSDKPLERYTGLRLMFHMLPAETGRIREFAELESARNEPLTRSIAASLLQEISYLLPDNGE